MRREIWLRATPRVIESLNLMSNRKPKRNRPSIEQPGERLQKQFEEASQRVALLERERESLETENAQLRERARLMERLRVELAEVNEKLSVLTRVSKEIHSLNAEKIFETATTKVPYLLGARSASIYVFEEGTRKLVLKRHTHDRTIDHVIDVEREPDRVMSKVVASGRAQVFTNL